MDDPVDYFSQQGFIQWLAIEPLQAGGGTATIRLTPKPEHLNHNGTLSAAVLYGLAEVAGAGAAVADMLDLAAQSYTVVKRANIEYLAPGRGVMEAIGRVDATVVERAKDNVLAGITVEVEVPVSVRDTDRAEVANVMFTLSIRPKRKPD